MVLTHHPGLTALARRWSEAIPIMFSTTAMGFAKGSTHPAICCLTGKTLNSCPAPFAKIFTFPFYPNHFYIPRRPVPNEGRIAIVTDVGNGMRWTLAVRLTKRADAGGEVVWS